MDWYADIVATIALGLSGRAFLQERKAKLEPQLDLEPLLAAHQMALRITSLGPLDYRTVRLRVVQPPENLRPPIEAVMFEHVWGQEVDLGPLRRGEIAEVLCGGGRTPQRAPPGWCSPAGAGGGPGRCCGRSGLKDPHRSSKSPLSEVWSRPRATNRIDRAPPWNSRHVILLVIPPGTTQPYRSACAGRPT
jgi:hypothetical protein